MILGIGDGTGGQLCSLGKKKFFSELKNLVIYVILSKNMADYWEWTHIFSVKSANKVLIDF